MRQNWAYLFEHIYIAAVTSRITRFLDNLNLIRNMKIVNNYAILYFKLQAVGNHELDNGVAGFVPFLKNVNFPVISCNMDTTGEPSLTYLIKKSVVLEIGGEQIGVIGYTTSLAPMLTNTGEFLSCFAYILHMFCIN